MKLLAKEIENTLPGLYSTEEIPVDSKSIHVKFFSPVGAGEWYGCEYDPVERLFFGYVNLFEGEWGYFSLDELENLKLPFGMKIERDIHFTPCRFSELNI